MSNYGADINPNDFLYRGSFTITESKGENRTDFIFRLELNSDNFYFPFAQDDGADFRVAESSGGTGVLNMFIGQWDTTEQRAHIYFKLPAINANQTKTLYVFWGNENATGISDIDSVGFDFADDFDGTTLDFTKWSHLHSNATVVSDSTLKIIYGGWAYSSNLPDGWTFTRTSNYGQGGSLLVDEDGLRLSNTGNHAATQVYHTDAIPKEGIITARFEHRATDNHTSGYTASSYFYIRNATSYTRETSYGRPSSNNISVTLGSSTDTTDCTQMAATDCNTLPITIDESEFQEVVWVINSDTRDVTVDLVMAGQPNYTISGTIDQTAWDNIGSEFQLEFSHQASDSDGCQIKNLSITTTSGSSLVETFTGDSLMGGFDDWTFETKFRTDDTGSAHPSYGGPRFDFSRGSNAPGVTLFYADNEATVGIHRQHNFDCGSYDSDPGVPYTDEYDKGYTYDSDHVMRISYNEYEDAISYYLKKQHARYYNYKEYTDVYERVCHGNTRPDQLKCLGPGLSSSPMLWYTDYVLVYQGNDTWFSVNADNLFTDYELIYPPPTSTGTYGLDLTSTGVFHSSDFGGEPSNLSDDSLANVFESTTLSGEVIIDFGRAPENLVSTDTIHYDNDHIPGYGAVKLSDNDEDANDEYWFQSTTISGYAAITYSGTVGCLSVKGYDNNAMVKDFRFEGTNDDPRFSPATTLLSLDPGLEWVTVTGTILSGPDDPDYTIGKIGDYYINTSTSLSYKRVADLYVGTEDKFNGGTTSASTQLDEGHADYVFDGSLSDPDEFWPEGWASWSRMAGDVLSFWVNYDFGVGNAYPLGIIRIRPAVDHYVTLMKDWIFYGSNNFSDWTELASGQVPNLTQPAWYEVSFSNTPDAYRYYRFYITTKWEAGLYGIDELEGFEVIDNAWVQVPYTPRLGIYRYFDPWGRFNQLTDWQTLYFNQDVVSFSTVYTPPAAENITFTFPEEYTVTSGNDADLLFGEEVSARADSLIFNYYILYFDSTYGDDARLQEWSMYEAPTGSGKYTVQRLRLRPSAQTSEYDYFPKKIYLYGTDGQGTWNTVLSGINTYTPNEYWQEYAFDNIIDFSSYKLRCEGNWGGPEDKVIIAEWEMNEIV